jgi:hypothetical protein
MRNTALLRNIGEVWNISTRAHWQKVQLIKQYQDVMGKWAAPCFCIYLATLIYGNRCKSNRPESLTQLGFKHHFEKCFVWNISTLREDAP